MAESYTPRMGVRRWTADGDTFSRDEIDLSFQNIEARAAIFGNGALSARPAAGVQGRFYVLDSTEPNAAIRGQTYYDTGTAWVLVQFDLTSVLATKANVTHSHPLADLPVANNSEVSTSKLVRADDARLSSEWQPGDILWSAATSRVGFVKADGASYTTASQPALFAKIGYTYGGSGGNFNVPNANDRFIIGSASGAKALGVVGGDATKVLAVSNLPGHTHTLVHTHDIGHTHPASTTGVDSPDHTHGQNVSGNTGGTSARTDYVNDVAGQVYPQGVNTTGANTRHTHTTPALTYSGNSGGASNSTTSSTGSGTAFDVMNPWLALNCFIKT